MTTDTATAAATADPLAAASLEALEMYRAARDAGRAKEEQFRATVHPKIWELHNAIVEQGHLTREAATDLHVAELCRHAPALAPMIRLLWAHVIDCRLDDVGACCGADGPVAP